MNRPVTQRSALTGWLNRQFRFVVLRRRLGGRAGLRVLDVGCGSLSPVLTRQELEGCFYCGLDRATEAPFVTSHTAEYIATDLEADRLGSVAGRRFDAIVLSHVIEHLENGLDIVREAAALLAPGGVIYVEYPSLRSASLPSMPGTLNFWDDPTHKRFYALTDIANAMAEGGVQMREGGRRRHIRRIALAPLAMLALAATGRPLRAGLFWDLLGFADYAVGLKPGQAP